jgi:hypothetical protein
MPNGGAYKGLPNTSERRGGYYPAASRPRRRAERRQGQAPADGVPVSGRLWRADHVLRASA